MSSLLFARSHFGIKVASPSILRAARIPSQSRGSKIVAMAHSQDMSIGRSRFQKSWLMALVMLACVPPSSAKAQATNVLGGPLELCCTDPMTGFHRDGYCRVSPADGGVHAVCAKVTQEFLDYSASKGNDLTSVVKPGEKWCLCVSRWKEAKVAGKAPPIILASTSEDALSALSLDELKEHALDAEKVQ